MAYGLIRVRNLSAGELRGTEIHNFRQYDELGMEQPENISRDPRKVEATNSQLFDSQGLPIFESKGGMVENLHRKLAENGINPRKNSVLAVEYAVGASAEFFEKGNYSWSTFLDKAAEFVAEKHGGRQNIVSVSFHYDEGNPHAHIIALPIVEKSVKWKNSRGSGERTEKRLCARDFTGGPEKLSKMQDEYFEFCKQFEGYGEHSVKFYRGTKAAEQLKHYTKFTNHEIGVLRQEISTAKDLATLQAKKLELEVKEAEMIKKTTELQQRIEIKKEQNGKKDEKTDLKKWKKDRDFGINM